MRIFLILFFISSSLLAQVSNYKGLKLQLTAGVSIITDSSASNFIKQINDCSKYNNHSIQNNHSLRPINNGSFWTFSNDETNSANNSSLKITDKLTIYSRINTTTVPNFGGISIQNYNGTSSGWGNAISSNKTYQTVFFSKTNISQTGIATINNGVNHKIVSTVHCSKKWSNYSKSISDGEEPAILKVNGIYYLYRDSANNVYVDSSTSPYFTSGVKARKVITGSIYPGVLYKSTPSATYYITSCNIALDTIYLYSSTSPTFGFTRIATVATKASGSLSVIADPEIIFVQDSFKCYYSAFSAPSIGTIYMATSKTGTSWSVKGTCVPNGISTDFDFTLCADPNPCVLNDGSLIMFYTGYRAAISKQQTGYATSSDGGITWTKFSGNPIFYFSGQDYESGIYGPNEISFLYEADAGPGGVDIWRCYYRCKNSEVPFRIGYFEFFADESHANKLPICGNESIVTSIYVDGTLDVTSTISGSLGIDYIPAPTQPTYLGGNGVNYLRYTGDLYDVRVYNIIKTNF